MKDIDQLEADYSAAVEARRVAANAEAAALLALNTAKEQLALEGVGAPFPVGTRMKCVQGRHMGDFGVIEAVTRASEISRWDYRPGSFIIRKLKKDGTPSVRYDTPGYKGKFENWEPV